MSNYELKYSYKRVPTLKKFAECDAPVRGIVGPFGCLPEDTEVLTSKGWKKFSELSLEDKVAQWNPTTFEINFISPLQIFTYPAKNWYVFLDSDGFEMKVSPEHRIPFFRKGRFEVETANEFVFNFNPVHIPRVFNIMNKHKYNRFFLKLYTIFALKGINEPVIRLEKPKFIKRLQEILAGVGFNYKVRSDKGGLIFEIDFKAETGRFPEKWYDLSSEALEVIVDEALYWSEGGHGLVSKTIETHIEENAKFLQFACHALGFITPIYNRKGVFVLKPHKSYKYYTLSSRFEDAKPDEVMFSLKVPTSFYVVRQKGNVFITGNSGKSSACTIEIIRRGLAQEIGRSGKRKTRFAVVRQTFRQLEDTTKKTIFDWLPPSIFGEYRISKNEYIITAFPDTEIEILFRALDKPDDVNNLMSLELTGAWVNEAREVSVEIIDALTGRIGRYPSVKDGGCTWSGIWMDTNPPDEESWWFKRFEIEKPEGWVVFHQPSGLSPEAENLLTPEEYEELKKNPDADIVSGLPPDYYQKLIQGKSEDFIKVYVKGEYGVLKQGKPVFEKSYSDSLHWADRKIEPIKGLPIAVGFDFGLNPSAVIGQVTPKGILNILDELTSDGVGLEQFIKYYFKPFINEKYYDHEILIIGDPAGVQRSQSDESSCFDILKKHGFKAIPARSNTLVDRIGAVEYFLNSLVEGKPRFQLSNTCPLLRKAFMSGYHYRRLKVSGERYTETPDKNWASHLMDALQYLCLHFSKDPNSKRIVIPKQMFSPAISYAGY